MSNKIYRFARIEKDESTVMLVMTLKLYFNLEVNFKAAREKID